MLYSFEAAAQAIRYYVRHWEIHRPRYFKGHNILPTLGQLRVLHAQVVPESHKMLGALEAKAAYAKWVAANPASLYPPDDINSAYEKAKADLKALGL